jgi:hypothetical protein
LKRVTRVGGGVAFERGNKWRREWGVSKVVSANLFLANPRLNLTSHLPWRIYQSKKTALGTPASPGPHQGDKAWCMHAESFQSVRRHSASHPRVLACQDVKLPPLPSPELPLGFSICARGLLQLLQHSPASPPPSALVVACAFLFGALALFIWVARQSRSV